MRLGYWVSEKKGKKLNFEDFAILCRNAGLELVKLDLDSSIEDQGPFDLIIHKLTDVLAKVGEGYDTAKLRMQRFQDFTEKHPECIIVDPLDSIYKLLDRYEQYKVVQQCDLLGSHVFTPSFVELTTTDVETNKRRLREANIQYPIVCKPTVAHGSQFSHQMLLVFNDSGLKDIQPPCVAQTFINHGARLYKLFVIGENMRLVERPSLRNFAAGDHETIFFDAHDVSKPYSCHDLNVLDETNDQGPVQPDLKKMQALSDDLRSLLKMDLFGVDVIIDCDTERYAVIDINFFPGYEGVPEFFHLLLKLTQKLLIEKKRKDVTHGTNNNDETDVCVLQLNSAIQDVHPRIGTNGHVSLPQDGSYKRLKLCPRENGVQALDVTQTRIDSDHLNVGQPPQRPPATTTVVTNGNSQGLACTCMASSGRCDDVRVSSSQELENGLSGVRSNGIIVGDIDRQLL